MSSNDNLKSKPDIGFFNSDIISDNEMEIDDTEENDLNKNESKKEQIPTSNQNVQKSKTQKVIHISAPTLSEIESDVLTKLANLNWNNTKSEVKFDPNVVKVIWNELKSSNFSLKKIMLIEFNQYLEKVINLFKFIFSNKYFLYNMYIYL